MQTAEEIVREFAIIWVRIVSNSVVMKEQHILQNQD